MDCRVQKDTVGMRGKIRPDNEHNADEPVDNLPTVTVGTGKGSTGIWRLETSHDRNEGNACVSQ